ncbi:uncharacterized protein BP5553_01022 [Venustampulla echinocandica]|uniref:Uncharacterized protein n=1 Tax=Venustampulla echinocandica TaxID=2656787 RepID=A0A370TZU1_9HELO|nr:uncharacterized protein BP5553_01022 [Venustampulla echinocandica]RDL41043.1 hypothetical protein BP5553_01022 [Venustampulla echinocandica]
MITRLASGPHTCLRCQRRLIKNHVASQLQIAFNSTDHSPKPGPGLEDPDSSASKRKKPPPEIRRTLFPASEYLHPERPGVVSTQYRVVQEELGKFYGFRGYKLVKERELLEANRFGHRAEIIVLRESKISKYDFTSPKFAYEEGEENPEKVNILARLDNERGLVSQDEVEANINSFRPRNDEGPNNWDEFNDLVRRLQEAFTTSQLQNYIDHFEEQQTSGLATESRTSIPSANDNTLILQRSPWVPEYADFSGSSKDASLRGYALASHTSKQRVVVRLLRECWELELQELVESIGQTEILLRPGDLDLLSQGSMLDLIKKSILAGKGEKLEAFHLHGIIRITATEKTSDRIIREIERVLKNIKRIQFSLVDLMPPPIVGKSMKAPRVRRRLDPTFDDTTLAELGRITNTHVTRLPRTWSHGRTDFPVSISCLTTPNDTWLSNQANIAQRLLVTSDDFSNRNKYQLACKRMPEGETGTFVKYGSTESLHWRERLCEWTRWTVPIHRQPTPRASDQAHDQLNGAIGSADIPSEKQGMPSLSSASQVDSNTAMKPSFETEKGLDTGKYWSDTYKIESSAIFGSVLHCHRGSTPEAGPETTWGTNNAIHTFSPALPTVSPILQQTQLPHYLRTESLTLRFQPNPFYVDPQTNNAVGAVAFSAFPPLEMHFDVSSDDRRLKLRAVDAVIAESKTDLMLPDYAVDVRFHQKTTSRLRSCWLDLPEIKEFLKCSNLTKKSRRIDLPPTLNMRIANHLCKDPELKILGRDTNSEMQEVQYLLVGRETRSTLELAFQDWKLQYTSIDQGNAEGKRSELKLRPIKTEAGGTQEEYLETVLTLADAFGTDSMFSTRRVLKKDDPTRMSVVTSEGNGKPAGMLFTDFAKENQFQDDTENTNEPINDVRQSDHS